MKEEIRKAIDLLNSGQLEKSEEICLSLLKEDKNNSSILNILGVINLKNDNLNVGISFFEKSIKINPNNHMSFFNLGHIYNQIGELDKSIENYELSLEIDETLEPAYQGIIEIYKTQNRLNEALNLIEKIEKKNLNFKNIPYLKAQIYFSKNDFQKASDILNECLDIDPKNFNALSFFGEIKLLQNNLHEAIDYFQKAIDINKQSHDLINISICYNMIGKLDNAEQYLIEANRIFPENILTYVHLAVIHLKKGNTFTACKICHDGLKKFDTLDIPSQKKNTHHKKALEERLLDIIEDITVVPELSYDEGSQLIEENYSFFLKSFEDESDLNIEKIKSTTQNTIKNFILNNGLKDNEINIETLKNIASQNYMMKFISKIYISSIIVEDFMIDIRSFLLELIANNDLEEIKEEIDISILINLISSIALQCFHNEYIWTLKKDDLKNKEKIKKSLIKLPQEEFDKTQIYISTIATTESLNNFKEQIPYFNNLENTKYSNLLKIIEYQINDSRKEQKIKKTIKILDTIKDSISKKVQNQYESYPYPRWNMMEMNNNDSYSYIIQTEISPNTFSYTPKDNEKTRILIAGCGTGRHVIRCAMNAQNSIVTALDLSADSLAYGIRKADEIGVSNIEWIQGDILEINKFNYNFDYIESSGVLHHMKNPKDGFKSLSNQLKPKGLMKLGLYSAHYKKGLDSVKKYIKKNQLKKTKDDIDLIRNYIKKSEDKELVYIKNHISDFFVTSEFIDLLLHEQEAFTTIPELKKLFENDFDFLGFVFGNREREYYKKYFKEDFKQINLENWNTLENKTTDLFKRMYQFWLQKK